MSRLISCDALKEASKRRGTGFANHERMLRVVVIGVTGKVRTSSLSMDPEVTLIRGLARRLPRATCDKTEFHGVDVARDSPAPLFRNTVAEARVPVLVYGSARSGM